MEYLAEVLREVSRLLLVVDDLSTKTLFFLFSVFYSINLIYKAKLCFVTLLGSKVVKK